ncbi:MAG: outer membrane protein transport protein [Candidatus Kapabacteria bacterium]|jgi:hypothetical protein|nr:outer membrane protein transport protein [Candidatus Kapabacteria bacterium]
MKTLISRHIQPSFSISSPADRHAWKFCITVLVALFGTFSTAKSQAVYLEDGLRYAVPNGIITPRAGALGLAYAGIADDFAALYVNPAGLTMLPLAEFSASGQFLSYNGTATHFGTTQTSNRTSGFLGHIGIALPVRIGDAGNYTIAIGYSREADFTGGDSISGFNTATSLINTWVTRQQSGNLNGNPAWETALADVVGNRFITPLRNNLQQEVGIRERGAMNNLSIGLGVDILRNLSLGITFVGTFGEYNYRRVFREIDAQNRYTRLDARNLTDIDFREMRMVEFIDQGFSGSRLIFGAQGRFGDNIRAGASFTLPLGFQAVEQFSNSYSATFDNNETRFFNPNDPAPMNIAFTMPWVLNVGASANFSGITFTGSAEISDMRAIRARGSAIDATAIEQAANALLTTQLRAGVGVEYDIPNRPFVVRGSYTYFSSPYLQSVAGGVASLIGLGGGFYLAPNSRIDVSYRATLRNFNNALYSGTFYASEQTLHQIAAQFVVRF